MDPREPNPARAARQIQICDLRCEGLLSLGAVPLGTDVTSAALSILDFNIFRIEMINALNLLDQSIRDITAATPPVCL